VPPTNGDAREPGRRRGSDSRKPLADHSGGTGEAGERTQARFLLLSEVAAELSVTDSQVYHLVRSGELPAIKIGGRGQWRVERSKLEEYIEAKYTETAAWVRENPLIERD
jgi:excisionase family DNA binding protein